MEILITGGNGLLGRHLVTALQERGESVRVLVLPIEDSSWLERRGVAVYRGDICQPETLAAPVNGVQAVFHLAGMMGLWRPLADYRAVNVTGAQNVCHAALAAGVGRVVHVSSWTVYGMGLGEPVREDYLLRPFAEPYAVTKAAGDLAVQQMIVDEHLPAVIIRPGTFFGPGDQLHFGRIADRLRAGRGELCELGIGGTAAGTGLNATPGVRERVCRLLAQWYDEPLVPARDLFASMQSMAPFIGISGGMRTAAIEVSQVCNDLRLLVSGPKTGFGELVLPAVQPGSSIMPGKVNPAIAEMVNMVCFQVIGNDTAVVWGAGAGQLELNVMMPGINFAISFSATILANALRVLRTKTVEGMRVDEARAKELMDLSPSLIVTALSPHIGYAKSTALVKRALAEKRSLIDVAKEEKVMDEAKLRQVLDPLPMTKGGVQ